MRDNFDCFPNNANLPFFQGSPYVAPSEIVQKIMERLREHESQEMEIHSCNVVGIEQNLQEGRLSVLSPDNRQFLDQPRSKSPDMRNKRMIIGSLLHFSFLFNSNRFDSIKKKKKVIFFLLPQDKDHSPSDAMET